MRRRGLVPDARPLVVLQDLPVDSPRIPLLIHEFVFPAWFRGAPLCFFSLAGREEYPGRNLRSGGLHADLDAVVAFLAREQLTRLLEMCEVPGASRSDPVRSAADPPPVPLDDDLDPSQAAAAAHGAGPMRVLAPAGSGKTKTLVNRVCNLVNRGVDPGSILPLAFNTKAAAEMNSRLQEKSLGRVEARTFHSIGYEIVRSGSRLAFDAGEESVRTRALLKEALQVLCVAELSGEGGHFEQFMRVLSRTKMDLLPLEGMSVMVRGEAVPFGPVFERFLGLQEERGFMNYDDMIYFAVRILLDNAAIRRRYQEAFTYLLVDEFQDLNRAQILLLGILALPEDNLFIVGDDDQLIYGWRGADVRSMIDFPRLHPCAREAALSTNYRSAEGIVVHAGWLINRNSVRVPKSFVPRAGAPAGEFEVVLCPGLWEQAQSAAEWIVRKKGTGPWRDVAVLFRYNVLRYTVALALDRLNVPHTGVDPGRLFDSRAGRDIAAWLKIVLLPGLTGRSDTARALSRPERLLRRSLVDRLETWHDVEALPGTGVLTREEEKAVRELLARIAAVRLRADVLPAHELIEELDTMVHLRASYGRRRIISYDPDQADDGTYLDVISALSQPFGTAADFLARIEISRTGGNAAHDQTESTPVRDEVVLSTIHRAKGNEFRRVVFFDLSRRHRPGREESEEERRVAYVAITRAKDSLLITANGRRQSPFLREAALDPQFAGRMREDMESELRGLRKRLSRSTGRTPSETEFRLRRTLVALEEELRCRDMLSRRPASP